MSQGAPESGLTRSPRRGSQRAPRSSCAGKDPCASPYSYESGRFLQMPALLDKRLIVVTGKGGVGRTTISAALGLAAARAGKRTMIAEVAQQERLSRVFRREGLGYSEARLAPNLFGMSVDPQRALEDRKSTRLNSSHMSISYAVFCLKKKKKQEAHRRRPLVEMVRELRNRSSPR